MKKLLYSVLALAGILAVSCNKETEIPVAPELTGNTHIVTLKAAFAQEGETRTAYANNKTFSWVAGDVVYVRCLNEETDEWYWAAFTADNAGAETTLTGEVEDGYAPYDVAVYVPGEKYVGSYVSNGSNAAIVAPISYHLDGFGLGTDSDGDATPYWNSVSVPSDNPLSLLPLVSVEKDDVLYFQTAMGVLNLNLTDVSADATHVRIISGDKYLGNYLMIVDGMVSNEVPLTEEDEEGTSVYATSYMEYYFQPASDGTVSLMMPLPVGTLATGTTIEVRDANGAVLFAQTTRKDIVIERNKIMKLAPLAAVASWEKLGTGKFVDNFLWEEMGADADTYVDVEIEKSMTQDGYYRIVNPYGAAAKAFNYTAPHKVVGPQDIVFHIMKVGESLYGTKVTLADQIYWNEVCSGIDADDSYVGDDVTVDDLEYIVHHPGDYRNFSAEEKWGRSLVAKYGADGNPANVLMGPIYLWGADSYWSGNTPYHETNNMIQILFPGVSAPVELDCSVSFIEVTDETPAQAIANASIVLGNDVVSAKMVIATDLAAAKAAIAADQNVTFVTQSGEFEVLFPANAPSGEYQVFALTQTKDGFTAAANQYLTSDSFKYYNANDDLGFTLDDVTGDFYNDTFVNYYYGAKGWDWYYDQTFFVRIEESDEESLGNVMITILGEFQGQYYIGPNTEYVTNVYGMFNTRTGELVFPGDQPIYDWSDEDAPGEGPYIAVSADMSNGQIQWNVNEPGSIVFSGQIYLRSYDPLSGSLSGYYQVFNGYPSREYILTRDDSTEAPAMIRRQPAGPSVKMSKMSKTGTAVHAK